jgi:hypothetical protein
MVSLGDALLPHEAVHRLLELAHPRHQLLLLNGHQRRSWLGWLLLTDESAEVRKGRLYVELDIAAVLSQLGQFGLHHSGYTHFEEVQHFPVQQQFLGYPRHFLLQGLYPLHFAPDCLFSVFSFDLAQFDQFFRFGQFHLLGLEMRSLALLPFERCLQLPFDLLDL